MQHLKTLGSEPASATSDQPKGNPQVQFSDTLIVGSGPAHSPNTSAISSNTTEWGTGLCESVLQFVWFNSLLLPDFIALQVTCVDVDSQLMHNVWLYMFFITVATCW